MTKERNPDFVAAYKASYLNLDCARFNSSLFRAVFSDNKYRNLPCTFEEREAIVVSDCGFHTRLKLRPMAARHIRKSRVFCYCVYCQKDVPAGRIEQHKCEHKEGSE